MQRFVMLVGAAALAATPVIGQEAPSLSLELNALQPTESGCRVTFVATNRLGAELEKSAVEIALFGADGGIERLVSLDFRTMPEGKTRVLQFDLADLACDGVSRVLVNDIVACEGEGIEPRACLDRLETRTATTVAFGT